VDLKILRDARNVPKLDKPEVRRADGIRIRFKKVKILTSESLFRFCAGVTYYSAGWSPA